MESTRNDHDRVDGYAREDVGNLVLLEHVNLTIPDQRLATAFYVSALGLTRDPFLMTGVTNMWINIGRSQVHLPHGRPQRLRGHVGLVVGERQALLARLRAVRELLEGTAFGWEERADRVTVMCPWGNRYDCLDCQALRGTVPWADLDLGIAYVQLGVPVRSAAPIAAFYREIFEARAEVRERDGTAQAVVAIGTHQQLVFAETAAPIAAYDGHHIQLYVADFSRPHARLAERGLSYGEEPHQYRFAEIVDLASGASCFQLEHEVRSLRHPLYARPLVNRNPEQSNRDYRQGADARAGAF
ncbi:VOC family protein [Paraburkholderia acidisoli]|uniref:Glyoxalase/bleomycin resistance/dioxygenase family protein n=1 Tax=Paraburkholderia acidisoli TaxID=2571748 RepID=A0A7Z2GP61_9BURK|nr:VOC family protein [Paraburkholderia acidisoli]QGZ65368.1 glyoxalase/bleomycin resistance/dioxygenase family protein [Paraburkholderia acidisoli]